MHPVLTAPGKKPAIPIWFVTAATWPSLRARLRAEGRTFASSAGFEPKPGRHLVLPAADGSVDGILFGLEDGKTRNPFLPGSLPAVLPPGSYRFANSPHEPRLAALAFALGAYRFSR